MSDCDASIWKPRTQCENVFDGANPTLANELAALIVGTSDPTTGSHIAMGPQLIQAKANATEAQGMGINALGGDVTIGGEESTITAWNLEREALERVLTESDRFLPVAANPLTGVAHTIGGSNIGFITEVTNVAGTTLTINDSSKAGVNIGDIMSFFTRSNVGILGTNAVGDQFLIRPISGTAVEFSRSCSFQYVAVDTWLYTGP
jgi:hypothetical protein